LACSGVPRGVTPSAISQTVRVLEARIGAALFVRTTRSVGLSEAGERFLARAKPAFEELSPPVRLRVASASGQLDCCVSGCRAR
jgi:DNA-binding transcriptional LysR family regulator